MRVKVTKTTKNDNTYRTPLDQLDGMPFKPEVGKRLLLTSSTFESGGIVTSIVKHVEHLTQGTYMVDTENSSYHIEELGDE